MTGYVDDKKSKQFRIATTEKRCAEQHTIARGATCCGGFRRVLFVSPVDVMSVCWESEKFAGHRAAG